MDPHVTEPAGTEICYSAKETTATGGHLDRDDNAGVCGSDTEPGGVENVVWPAVVPRQALTGSMGWSTAGARSRSQARWTA
jgi:hypothetical protein